MRRLKFRGKDIRTGKWIYGTGVKVGRDKSTVEIYDEVNDLWIGVVPETVCQYLGLNDCTGREIYENDIL